MSGIIDIINERNMFKIKGIKLCDIENKGAKRILYNKNYSHLTIVWKHILTWIITIVLKHDHDLDH
jgi:hypothetical protein